MGAHADYNCCACCDSRLEYVGSNDSTTKVELCDDCVSLFYWKGFDLRSGDDLLEFILNQPLDLVYAALSICGFRFCYYTNDIDNSAFLVYLCFIRLRDFGDRRGPSKFQVRNFYRDVLPILKPLSFYKKPLSPRKRLSNFSLSI